MQVQTVKGILQTTAHGGYQFAGWVSDETTIPEGVRTSPVQVLNLEDNTTNRWVIAMNDPIAQLDTTALNTIAEGEVARAAKAKLTDEELAALGLTRD